MSTILCEMTDPRGKCIVLYEDTWVNHIVEGHPEMEGNLHALVETIEDPDLIREGRSSSTELYLKINSVSNMEFTGIFAATKIIDDQLTLVTTSYEGDDNTSKGTTKWTKTNGEVL